VRRASVAWNVTNISCWLKPELLAFSNGGSSLNEYGKSHDNWLPSFNVRFGLTDKQFVRFAASRAMSRPDFGLLRNFVGVQSPAINTGGLAVRDLERPDAAHTRPMSRAITSSSTPTPATRPSSRSPPTSST
jgi:hypothetical protein